MGILLASVLHPDYHIINFDRMQGERREITGVIYQGTSFPVSGDPAGLLLRGNSPVGRVWRGLCYQFAFPGRISSSWFFTDTRVPGAMLLVMKALPPMTASCPITVSPPSTDAPE